MDGNPDNIAAIYPLTEGLQTITSKPVKASVSNEKNANYGIGAIIASKHKNRDSSLRRLTKPSQSAGFPRVNYTQINPRGYKRRQSAIINFVSNGPYTTKNYKIDKLQVLKSAFAKDIDIIYDQDASRLDKIRRILLSPQWNLIVILLIIIDWVIAVCALLTDMFHENSLFEDFAQFFSIGLLSMFILEILLKIFLLPGIFFRSKLELFDAFIVLTSFTFEVILIVKNIDFAGVSSVLTMFRLWRILRLINSKNIIPTLVKYTKFESNTDSISQTKMIIGMMIAVETNVFKELNAIREDVIALLVENEKLKNDLESLVVANMMIRPLSGKPLKAAEV